MSRIIFNATASGIFPKEKCEAVAGSESATVCSLSGSPDNIKLGISALSWTSSDRPMDRGPLLPWV